MTAEPSSEASIHGQLARLIEQGRAKLEEVDALRKLAESHPSTNSERLNGFMDAEGQRLLQSELDSVRKTIEEEVAQERARLTFASAQPASRKKPPRQMA